MNERPKPKAVERVQQRRERHRQRSKVYRAGWILAGFLVTAAGVVMTGPVPGPGILVIPVGLAMLALEFDWAQRLLDRALERFAATTQGASEMSHAQKLAAGAAVALTVSAFVTAAILWDIPLLPF